MVPESLSRPLECKHSASGIGILEPHGLSESKLFQESYVVFVEEAHVVDLVFEKGDPFKSYSECKSSVFFRIDSAHLQHVWMNHTASKNLDPA